MAEITLLPASQHQIIFTPIEEQDQPFARVKREFPDFKALRTEYDTFAELIADTI